MHQATSNFTSIVAPMLAISKLALANCSCIQFIPFRAQNPKKRVLPVIGWNAVRLAN